MKSILGGVCMGLGMVIAAIGAGVLVHAAVPFLARLPEPLVGASLVCIGGGLLLIARALYVAVFPRD